jgi:hypothetical protein
VIDESADDRIALTMRVLGNGRISSVVLQPDGGLLGVTSSAVDQQARADGQQEEDCEPPVAAHGSPQPPE